jgi:hypothetical protein
MHTYAHVHTNIRHIHTYGHTYAHTHTSIHTRECTQGEPGSVPAWPDYDNIALLTGFGADALATMERNVQVWCAGDTSMCACSHLCHDGAQCTGVVCGGHRHVCVLTFVPRWSATHRCGVRGTSACVLTFAPRWSAAHRCGVRGTPAFVCADVCNTCVHTCLCVVSQGRWSQVWRQPWPRGRWVRRDKLACVCVCFYVCDTCVHTCLCDVVKAGGVKCMTPAMAPDRWVRWDKLACVCADVCDTRMHTCLCDVVKAGGVKCMTPGMAPDRWVRWQRQLCKKLRTYGIHCVHVPHVCIRTLCMHTYSLCTSVLFVCYVLHVCVCTPTPCVHTYSMCTYILLM